MAGNEHGGPAGGNGSAAAAAERAKALFFEAIALIEAGHYATAEEKLSHSLALVPDRVSSLVNLAVALFHQDKADAALAAASRAAALDPGSTEALLLVGAIQSRLGRWSEALATFERLVAIDPEDPDAWGGRGDAALRLGDLDDARRYYRTALALNPAAQYLAGEVVHAALQACDWTDIDHERADLVAAVAVKERRCRPFSLLAVTGDAALQLKCAQEFSASELPASPQPARTSNSDGRVHVGYLSPDLREHPVSYLAGGVFEHHDRQRFHISAFSVGVDDRGPTRARLQSAFDAFEDCRHMSDAEVASAIGAAGIDILVDLAGHTADGRPRVMAARPAPVQVNWLGYPGTVGAAVYDYIVADAVVIPSASRQHYSEKVAELPECFQPNDDRRPLPDAPSRTDAGLPERGFVFCSFNASYKLNPETFAIWMRLLARIPDSVLWLAVEDAGARRRLRAEAEERGISGSRVVFAERLPYARHLARLRLADLFLDTLPFNAGTTASDALWAAVPVVTCPGEAFAARMAASLLTAAGLPELVTSSMADYEALALRLAVDPPALAALRARLAALRARLAAGRSTLPLFDAARYTRHLEAAYTAMWERSRQGLAPDHLRVPQLPR